MLLEATEEVEEDTAVELEVLEVEVLDMVVALELAVLDLEVALVVLDLDVVVFQVQLKVSEVELEVQEEVQEDILLQEYLVHQVDHAQQDPLDHLEKMDLMVKMELTVNQVKIYFINLILQNNL